MQNIIFIFLFFFGLLQADTVGMPEKSWVDAPQPSSANSVDKMSIGEEYVVPSDDVIVASTTTKSVSKSLFNFEDNEKYRKILLDFINPLWFFMRDYPAVFSTFVAFLSTLFYLFFYQPLAKRSRRSDDEDIMIPQAMLEKEKKTVAVVSESSIISQSQYASLYGLMNENFIYEKERILLDAKIPQEERNREVISLEWKFNQILHFALPKLSTTDVKRFKEGVKELLEEEVSRDIMIIALEDILQEGKLKVEDKEHIKTMLASFSKVERRQAKVVNYSNYMGQ